MASGGAAYDWAALLCLAASFCYALSMVLTRLLGTTESPIRGHGGNRELLALLTGR